MKGILKYRCPSMAILGHDILNENIYYFRIIYCKSYRIRFRYSLSSSSITLADDEELVMVSEIVSATTMPKVVSSNIGNILINYELFQSNVIILFKPFLLVVAYFFIALHEI